MVVLDGLDLLDKAKDAHFMTMTLVSSGDWRMKIERKYMRVPWAQKPWRSAEYTPVSIVEGWWKLKLKDSIDEQLVYKMQEPQVTTRLG